MKAVPPPLLPTICTLAEQASMVKTTPETAARAMLSVYKSRLIWESWTKKFMHDGAKRTGGGG